MMTPNKFGKILDKLPKEKTELSKIELSLAGDIKKALNTLRGQMKKADPLEEKMINMDEKVSVAIDKLKEMAKVAEKLQQEIWKNTDAGKVLIDRTEKAAKELGVAPGNIEGYFDFKDLRGNAYFAGKRLEDGIFAADSYK